MRVVEPYVFVRFGGFKSGLALTSDSLVNWDIFQEKGNAAQPTTQPPYIKGRTSIAPEPIGVLTIVTQRDKIPFTCLLLINVYYFFNGRSMF